MQNREESGARVGRGWGREAKGREGGRERT